MSQLARPSRVSRIPSRYRQTETEGDTPSRSQPTNNDAVVVVVVVLWQSSESTHGCGVGAAVPGAAVISG